MENETNTPHDADWTKRYAPIVTDDDGKRRVTGPVTR